MPLNQTLTAGLDDYGIGQKIRNLRAGKKLGLVELGRHTGLSAALLSKIERGKMYPTLPTLLRISLVFGVGLDHFFSRDPSTLAVVRHAERLRFPEQPKTSKVSFYFESLDYPATNRPFSAYLADFRPSAADDVTLHHHTGAEFIFVTEGTLGLSIGGAEVALEARDSVYFDARQPHGYRRIGRTRCQALVVVAPGSAEPD